MTPSRPFRRRERFEEKREEKELSLDEFYIPTPPKLYRPLMNPLLNKEPVIIYRLKKGLGGGGRTILAVSQWYLP